MMSDAERNSMLNGLELFKDRFSKFIVSHFDPNDLSNWEIDFLKALGEEKKRNWEKSKEKNPDDELDELIDFTHFKSFVIKNRKPLKEKYLDEVDRWPTWLDEIAEIRHNIAHFKKRKKIRIDRINTAWDYMDRIAVTINDPTLRGGLQKFKEERIQSTVDGKRWVLVIASIGLGIILFLLFYLLFFPLTEQKNNYAKERQKISKEPVTDSINIGGKANSTHPKAPSGQQSTSDLKEGHFLFDPNVYVNNIKEKVDVAVLIIDSNNNPVSSLSAGVANLYHTQNGQTITTSLFTTEFLASKYVKGLLNANSQLINNLNLSSKAKFVVIGIYTKDFEAGEMTKYLCRASLDVVVISCDQTSRVDGFQIEASNNYNDKGHAEKGAKEKILEEYQREHLKL
jgi:hypothetical protein